MNIALCHFRIGETDGVSLEMQKWEKALEMLGHNVFYIAGNEADGDVETIPALHYKNPVNEKIVANAFGDAQDYPNTEALQSEVVKMAVEIEEALIGIIEKRKPDLIVPNNIFSLGWNLAAGIAFFEAAVKTGIRVLCHHHDFHWERDLYAFSAYDFVKQILRDYFPPRHPNVSHVCINKLAQTELKRRYDIETQVVPNVFDFDEVHFETDGYNRNIRLDFDIKPGDIVFLQATRIVERKAIEIAVDFVSVFQKMKAEFIGKELYNGHVFSKENRIILLLAGQCESDEYYKRLKDMAESGEVDLLDISHRIGIERGGAGTGKIYSFWDAYQIADFVTYPSILEGWGNQLLEAFAAKLPVALYEYPVYRTDIAPFGFKVVSFGSSFTLKHDLVRVDADLIRKSVDDSIALLFKKEFMAESVEYNYHMANQHLSVKKLSEELENILAYE